MVSILPSKSWYVIGNPWGEAVMYEGTSLLCLLSWQGAGSPGAVLPMQRMLLTQAQQSAVAQRLDAEWTFQPAQREGRHEFRPA